MLSSTTMAQSLPVGLGIALHRPTHLEISSRDPTIITIDAIGDAMLFRDPL